MLISGASRLNNGSIIGATGARCSVGAGVIADGFIIQSGSTVDSAAVLQHCFIGQSVRIGKQFSAENSIIFANSELFHGEACSVFAGPYTVSHHKSSLLIAGFYSFFNAGSGTNQSNHLYKLGPLHQAVLERGAKTGSFSYMLCPGRVSAFTAVIGKHYSNFDASDFPFSYISEEDGKSLLTPAMNLLTVGTRRDSDKWPKRDRRSDGSKLDHIHFDLYSPWLIQKIMHAASLLKTLYDETDRSRESIVHKGLHLRRLMLKSAVKYYDLAIHIAAGSEAAKLLDDLGPDACLKKISDADPRILEQQWIDMAGMFLPLTQKDLLLDNLTNGVFKDLNTLIQNLHEIFQQYEHHRSEFFCSLLNHLCKGHPDLTCLTDILEKGTQSAIKLNNMILADADKEFSPSMRYGYGIDGDDPECEADFTAVRGKKENNAFVLSLLQENEELSKMNRERILILEEYKKGASKAP